MSNNDLVKQTIRIPPITKNRLKKLLDFGYWTTEVELIRQALNIGLDSLEKTTTATSLSKKNIVGGEERKQK